MDKKADQKDEEEDCRLGKGYGAEEHPVNRGEVQLAETDEDESRKGEGAHKGAQPSCFNITDEVEFSRDEAKEDDAKALHKGRVEVVEAGISTEYGSPIANHCLDGKAHRCLNLVGHHGCHLFTNSPTQGMDGQMVGIGQQQH